MAFVENLSAVDFIDESNKEYFWKYSWGPGENVPASGIYKCKKCGREVACNEDDSPMPPHPASFTDCRTPEWKLTVMANHKKS